MVNIIKQLRVLNAAAKAQLNASEWCKLKLDNQMVAYSELDSDELSTYTAE